MESYSLVTLISKIYCFCFIVKVVTVELSIENCRNDPKCATSTFGRRIDKKQFFHPPDAKWNVTYLTNDTFLVQMKRNNSNVAQSWECASRPSSTGEYPDRSRYDAGSYSYEQGGRWYSGFISKVWVKPHEQSPEITNITYYLGCRIEKSRKCK